MYATPPFFVVSRAMSYAKFSTHNLKNFLKMFFLAFLQLLLHIRHEGECNEKV